jgi:mono/diheme cytochrome c family protein
MKPWIKWTVRVGGGLFAVVLLIVIGVVVYVSFFWRRVYERPVSEMRAPADPATIIRGEYLFKNGLVCWECHSPSPDSRVAPTGGREFDLRNVGPGFGIFYSRNITPDTETGIGSWTDGQLVRALREGLRPDGTLLFPVMPVEAMRGLSDQDALSIVAYLRSLKPVRTETKESEPSFTAKALFAFGVLRPEKQITEPIPTPTKGISVEYGKYFANHASVCMECHTPRNLEDGSFYRDSIFAGSTIRFGQDDERTEVEAYARNIRPDAETGIGNWTEEQFLDAVRAGMRPDGTVLLTHMPYSYYGLLEEDDVKAIYVYLKSLEPMKRTTPPPIYSERYRNGSGAERGKVIFINSCMICHGEEGKGAAPTNAVLAELAPSINDQQLKEFISGGNVGLRMPAFGKTLSSSQIDDVIAYIRTLPKQ